MRSSLATCIRLPLEEWVGGENSALAKTKPGGDALRQRHIPSSVGGWKEPLLYR